ncbi:MAG: AmmeMemoRadiSam system radical SAM enzyme [Syntrophomonadaceae bacterium]|jgi:pyruvate formate lyase activating enzyme
MTAPQYHQAMFYDKHQEQGLICHLCPHHCRIKPGKRGICRVRSNQAGTLVTENYGRVASLALDPIEKKPLFHFFPGHMILSAGTFGCNLSCSFCQNYTLAHESPATQYISPETLSIITARARVQGSIGMAFTYNEPSIWYEYIWDCTQIFKEQGLKVVLVTNGYIEAKPLQKLLPCIDAMNIDVKAFTNDFYKRLCKGTLEPVLQTVKTAAQHTHVEVTTLLIPGENDQLEDIEALARWLASIRPEIPLHLSRYHPAYKYQQQAPTPEETLLKAQAAARQHLPFVYLGNVLQGNNTHCLHCQAPLIRRSYYQTELIHLQDGQCAACGNPIDYIIS